jgi:hypothetical protein
MILSPASVLLRRTVIAQSSHIAPLQTFQFRTTHRRIERKYRGATNCLPLGAIFGPASIAEFERELIRDRAKSGIAAARSKGKKLGRPKVVVDAAQIARLRASGASWPSIARKLGVSVGMAYQAAHSLSKIPKKRRAASD